MQEIDSILPTGLDKLQPPLPVAKREIRDGIRNWLGRSRSELDPLNSYDRPIFLGTLVHQLEGVFNRDVELSAAP